MYRIAIQKQSKIETEDDDIGSLFSLQPAIRNASMQYNCVTKDFEQVSLPAQCNSARAPRLERIIEE